MLAELLPPEVVVAESFGEPRDDGGLFPEEAEWIAKAVDRRRRDFSSVRACARQALRLAGLASAPIVPGHRGAPGWPEGVVGSLTHCDGYRGCALAVGQAVAALGIDAEPHVPLPAGVLDMVTGAGERAALASLSAAEPRICWDKILFSAKESVYKAWFPCTGRWLGFEDAELSFGDGWTLADSSSAASSAAGSSSAGSSSAGSSSAGSSSAGSSAAGGGSAGGSSAGSSSGQGSARGSSAGGATAGSSAAGGASDSGISATGTFSAALLVPGPVLDGVPLTGYQGRWLVRAGLVVTAVAVPPVS